MLCNSCASPPIYHRDDKWERERPPTVYGMLFAIIIPEMRIFVKYIMLRSE